MAARDGNITSADVRELSADDLAGVAGLCERELTLDRDAGANYGQRLLSRQQR